MSTALYLIWCSFFPPLHTDLFLFLTEFISLIFRPFPTGIHTLHPQLSCFFVHVVFVSAWESNGSAPGYQLTVCCTGSTGLHLCHSFPSRCLPYSAFRSRTCLTLQPLSEMDGRRKYTLLLWVPHTQWGATKCPSAASWKWKKRGGDDSWLPVPTVETCKGWFQAMDMPFTGSAKPPKFSRFCKPGQKCSSTALSGIWEVSRQILLVGLKVTREKNRWQQ